MSAGVVFMPSRYKAEAARQDELFLRSCREAGLGIVLIERNLRGLARSLEYDLVAADDFDGGLRCTRHLLDQGRRRIAFVTGSPTSSHEGRLAGYLRRCTMRGPDSARSSSNSLLASPAKIPTVNWPTRLSRRAPTAWFAIKTTPRLGLILELLNRGIRVPADIAITGFDDLPIGKAYSIGVTTYAFSSEAVARHATRLLRARLRAMPGPPVKVLIPGELIVRESSVPP